MLKQVEIFTDGSCLGNPGPGGYGAILRYRGKEKTFSEGFNLTTNNRMEMMAAIVALEALKEHCEQPVCASGDYAVDPQLEKTRLENGRQETGKKCRSLAAPGRRAGSTQDKMGMG